MFHELVAFFVQPPDLSFKVLEWSAPPAIYLRTSLRGSPAFSLRMDQRPAGHKGEEGRRPELPEQEPGHATHPQPTEDRQGQRGDDPHPELLLCLLRGAG